MKPIVRTRNVPGQLLRLLDGVAERREGDYVVIDSYGGILDIAPQLAADLAINGGRMVGRRLFNRLSASDRTPFMRSLNTARARGVWTADSLSLHGKGTITVDVRVRYAKFFDKPAGAIFLRLDVDPAVSGAAEGGRPERSGLDARRPSENQVGPAGEEAGVAAIDRVVRSA